MLGAWVDERKQYARDMARQRDLERCGWRFFRIGASEFYRDPDAALDPLWRLLADRGILPEAPPPAAGLPSRAALVG